MINMNSIFLTSLFFLVKGRISGIYGSRSSWSIRGWAREQLRQAMWFVVDGCHCVHLAVWLSAIFRQLWRRLRLESRRKLPKMPGAIIWVNSWRFVAKRVEKCSKISLTIYLSPLAGRFSFPENEWRDVSADAKDLISNLLVKEASKRLSAEAVLDHPWIRAAADENCDNDKRRRALKTPGIIRRWVKNRKILPRVIWCLSLCFSLHFQQSISS